MLNRFENHVLNTAEEGVAFVREVGKPNVKVHLDTFHMNIEEDSFGEAIRTAGPLLGHFHTGENNRRVPGKGRLPWHEIGTALREIGYDGAVVMEPFVKMGGGVGSDIKVWRDLERQRRRSPDGRGRATRFGVFALRAWRLKIAGRQIGAERAALAALFCCGSEDDDRVRGSVIAAINRGCRLPFRKAYEQRDQPERPENILGHCCTPNWPCCPTMYAWRDNNIQRLFKTETGAQFHLPVTKALVRPRIGQVRCGAFRGFRGVLFLWRSPGQSGSSIAAPGSFFFDKT